MEEKKSFMDHLNMFLIGTVIGAIVLACLCVNHYESEAAHDRVIIDAYEKYYYNTEVLLDSLDGTHNLDLMDTDLCSDYGANYLHAKNVVDSLTNADIYNE